MIQRKKLGEIANISAGQGAPQGAENYSEEGTPFVKAGDLFYLVNGERECDIQKVSEEVAKNHRLKLYPKGTVLFAKSGMSCMKGYVYATNAECYVVSHLACIMPFDVDSKYLKYYFEYHKPNQLVKDASYPSISLADIAEMPINVFDDQTEAKIVDNLDAVNSLIAKSKEELGLLDNIVKSRFVEMFGEPITNKMGWPCLSLVKTCKAILGGGTPSKSHPEYFTGGIPWVSPKDMKYAVISDSIDHITEEAVAHSTTNLVPKNSVLMVIRSGILKHTLPVAINSVPVTINQDMKAFVPGNGVITEFLMYYFKAIESDVLAGVRGVTADNIDFKAFQQRTIIVPPLELQNRFAAFVAEVDKSKLSYEMEVAA